MKFVWYGDRATQRIRRKLAANLDDAAETLVFLIQDKISIQGPPRSLPGEPPHIDSGDLIASYTHVTDTVTLRSVVGTNIGYAGYLETGTPNMAPRPHIVPTLTEHSDHLGRRMARP